MFRSFCLALLKRTFQAGLCLVGVAIVAWLTQVWVGWQIAYSQEPTPAEPPKPPSFQRIAPPDEGKLRAELAKMRVVDLDEAGPFVSLVQAAIAARDARPASGKSRAEEDAEPLPEQVQTYHKTAFQMLSLPGQTESNCQLEKDEARNLQTWSVKARQTALVSSPRRTSTSPFQTVMDPAALDQFAKKINSTVADGVPALVQMLGPEAEPTRKALVEALRKTETPAATTALARQAIFDVSPNVREAAVWALDSRPKDQYRSVFLAGMRYPWPPVAEHAAEALVALDDREAVPMLKRLLDEPDPAAPVVKPGTGKLPQVPQIVRINHFRNCLLCHAVSAKKDDLVRAPIMIPGQAIPAAYYASRQPPAGTIFVRADITYLRQDFSLMQRVEHAGPWPEMQRFDFVVGSRDATPEELARLGKQEGNATYPQREAVKWALAELSKK